jgi:type I restriction enzyme, S subunit
MSKLQDAERNETYALKTAVEPAFGTSFDLLATAAQGVKSLRALILLLATSGKLVAQKSDDHPASLLLDVLREEWNHRGEVASKRRIGSDTPPVDAQTAIPPGWQYVRLGRVLDMFNGRAFKPTDWQPHGMPIVRIQNLNNIHASYNYCDPATVQPQHTIYRDAFLISWSGTPGTSFGAFIWTGSTAALNQHIFKCEQVAPVYQPAFLRLAINSQLDVLISKAHGGAGLQHVTKGTLENLILPLPSLAEQARIVARVEELMQLCDALEAHGRLQDEQHARLVATLFDALAASASAEELAENWQRIATHFDLLLDRPEAVDAFEQAVLRLATHGLLVENGAQESVLNLARKRSPDLNPMFDVPACWAWEKLESVLESGPSNGFSPKPSESGEGVRCLTLSATTKGYFRAECYKFIDIDAQTAQRYYLKNGDLLIQRANSLEYVGIAAIYDGDDDEYTFPDLMMRMRVLPSLILNEYLHVWLISVDARWYMRSKATGTQGNMPKVNQGVVREMPVPLPPLTEQHRIVARVEQLRRLCADLRERLQQARATQSHLADALVSAAAKSPAC